MKQILLVLISACLWTGCNNKDTRVGNRTADDSQDLVSFARGFSLKTSNENLILTVRNPWQHAKNVTFTYILSDTLRSSVKIDDFTWAIKTPVHNVVCLSTTHIGYINYIHKTRSVTGISGKKFIVNDSIRAGLAQNSIYDVGYDENLDYELILGLKPDVVFAYGVSVSVTNTVNKLAELGIPVILIGEYLEQDALAKMEWVKAFAACYGVNEHVSARFDSTVIRYKSLVALTEKISDKPSVLLGLPFSGSWYVSGSKSYMARFITDAGGKYIWDHLDFNESRAIGLEKIYEQALGADIWINPGEARSKREIISVDQRFASLAPLTNDQVYNNDNQLADTGGNDFYESGVVEPDRILSDLIAIMHPQLLPSYQLKYYRKLH